jgi:hypothetical protein
MVMSVHFNDHSIEAGHARRSLRAGAVVVGARVLITFIQVLTFFVLARLLSPEDYGVVANGERHHGVCATVGGVSGHWTPWFNALASQRRKSAHCFGSAQQSGAVLRRFYGEPRLTGDRADFRAHICRERTVLPAQYTIATSNEIRGLSRRGDWRESAQRGWGDRDGSLRI